MKLDEKKPSNIERPRFNGNIRPLAEADLPAIQEILEMWLRDSRTGELDIGELDQDMENLRKSLDRVIKRSDKRKLITGDCFATLAMTTTA